MNSGSGPSDNRWVNAKFVLFGWIEFMANLDFNNFPHIEPHLIIWQINLRLLLVISYKLTSFL